MKLLLDENLSPAHALRMRLAGHDAVAVLDAGLGGADDAVVRQFALEQGRRLVTIDSDFSHIVRFPPENTPGYLAATVAADGKGNRGLDGWGIAAARRNRHSGQTRRG